MSPHVGQGEGRGTKQVGKELNVTMGIAKWLKKSCKGLHSTVHYTLTIVFVSYLFGQGMVVTPSRMGHCCH